MPGAALPEHVRLDILAAELPIDESVATMSLLDEIRRQGGIRFPADG